MKGYKIELGFAKFGKALTALEQIAYAPPREDRSNIDAAIQRFEFTIELFWKLLKIILETKGIEVQYPKDVLQEAFKGGLINHEKEWLKMLTDRNLTSHTYDEQLADKIFSHIQKYIPVLKEAYMTLHSKFQ